MKHFRSPWLACASAALAVSQLGAARPHYGGTLRVQTALTSADPGFRDRILPLAFETLTRVTATNTVEPLLATSWEGDARSIRWRTRLRSGVALHDGSTLQPWQAAASLRSIERGWRIETDGDTLVIDLPAADPNFPRTLADMRYAIRLGGSDESGVGSGPFRIERSDAGSLVLRAFDAYRAGRPFLDAVQIQLNRGLAAQLADLEAGRADLVTIEAIDARRSTQRGFTLAASRSVELIALQFEPHRATAAYEGSRRALSASLNRATIGSALLLQHGEAAESTVPSWLSMPPRSQAPRAPGVGAPEAVAALPAAQRDITLRVDASDALARAIAERIAVDAREAGFTLRVQVPAGLAPRADARIARIRIPPATPDRVRIEAALVDSAVVVPIVHVPDIYAARENVHHWNEAAVRATGAWNFADLWLGAQKP